jgi:hypothetical protein
VAVCSATQKYLKLSPTPSTQSKRENGAYHSVASVMNSFKESTMSAESQARTQHNFKIAMTNLQKLLPKRYSDIMDQLKVPEIDLSKEEEVESVFTVFMDAIKTCSQLGKENKKVRAVAKRWFEASVPFARIILTVGKSTSAVSFSASLDAKILDSNTKYLWGCL